VGELVVVAEGGCADCREEGVDGGGRRVRPGTEFMIRFRWMLFSMLTIRSKTW